MDNASGDRSRELLASAPSTRIVKIPLNIGHEVAMDIGFLRARTEYVVVLDVDVFPMSDSWIEQLIEPLKQGFGVAGAHLRNGFELPSPTRASEPPRETCHNVSSPAPERS